MTHCLDSIMTWFLPMRTLFLVIKMGLDWVFVCSPHIFIKLVSVSLWAMASLTKNVRQFHPSPPHHHHHTHQKLWVTTVGDSEVFHWKDPKEEVEVLQILHDSSIYLAENRDEVFGPGGYLTEWGHFIFPWLTVSGFNWLTPRYM